jgi:hypothetical protein
VVLATFRQFLKDPSPSRSQATFFLRFVFAVIFLGQVAVAALTGLVMALFGPEGRPNNSLSQVLVFLSLLQLPLVLIFGQLKRGVVGKGAAMSSTILAAVLFSTPVWYLVFALLIKVRDIYMLMLVGLLMGYYLLGFFLVSRFARSAVTSKRTQDREGSR